MKRPSHYLLMFSVLFVAGYLAVERWTPEAPLRTDPKTQPASKRPVSVKLQSPKPTAARTALAGRVFDPRGFLLVGAEVALGEGEHVRTDADGAFALNTSTPAPWNVTVKADGCRPLQRLLFPDFGDPLFFALEPAAPWDAAAAPPPPPAASARTGDGFVQDRDGKGLANAVVAVVGTGVRARTDEIGHYRIPLPEDRAELVVSQPETGLCGRSESLALSAAAGAVPLPVLVATPGISIRGIVCDPKGQPIEGVPLRLRGEGIERRLESGRDGLYQFSGLLAGSYELVAMAWRGAFGCSEKVQVTGAVADCNLHMRASEERRLRIVDDRGQPLPRAYVATSVDGRLRAVTRADDQGWVEVSAAKGATGFEVRRGDMQAMRVTQDADDQIVVVCPE